MYSHSPKDFWTQINLENIEPLTLVLYQEEKLYELIWDGFVKQLKGDGLGILDVALHT